MFGIFTVQGHLITITLPFYSPFLYIAIGYYIAVFSGYFVLRVIKLLPFV